MKLFIAPESKSALIECTLLVSVVLISIERIMDVPRVSRVLVESHLGNLFFYFGFRGRAFLSGAEREGVSISSLVSVLTFSTFNTANLFTSSDQGILFTGCTKQNSLPGQSKLPPPLLYPLELLSLQSIPFSVPQLTFRRLSSRDSPSQDDWPLHTDSTLTEVKSAFSGLHLCPWVFLLMV